MEKIFCIIPARYNSTRARGKVLRLILDKPLLEWTWENALKVSLFSDVFIATDSEEIEIAAKKIGGKTIKTSSSHECGTDRVAEAARILGVEDNDIIVNVQADEPLVSPSAIEKMILTLQKSKIIDMATLAYNSSNTEQYKNENIVKVVVDKNNFALYFSRSPIPYYRNAEKNNFSFLKHLGVYVYRMKFLQDISKLSVSSLEAKEKLEQLRVLESGFRIKAVISSVDCKSVDTKEDFKIAEDLLRAQI